MKRLFHRSIGLLRFASLIVLFVPAMSIAQIGSFDQPPIIEAEPLSTSSIELNWGWPVFAEKFNVYRNDVNIATVSDSKFVDVGLAAGTTYSYYVTTIRTSRDTGLPVFSPKSNEVDVATKGSGSGSGRTPSITNFREGATIGTTQVVDFSDNGTSVAEWWVSVGTMPHGWQHYSSGRLSAGTRSNTVSGLPVGTAYVTLFYKLVPHWESVSYRVTVRAGSGDTGEWGAPQSVGAAAISSTAIKVTWGSVPGARHYQLYRNDRYHSLVSGNQYIDMNLKPSTGYSYAVRAMLESGETSIPSKTVIAITKSEGANSSGAPSITNFGDGASIGRSQVVSFSANSTTVREWWLRVGTTQGGRDLYDSGRLASGTGSHTVSGLPVGNAHITLYYKDASGQWKEVHYRVTVSG